MMRDPKIANSVKHLVQKMVYGGLKCDWLSRDHRSLRDYALILPLPKKFVVGLFLFPKQRNLPGPGLIL